MNFQDALLLLPGLIIGLTVHEAAHAISAKWLGDRTSEKMGRISLNPMRHLSIYGTLAIFFLGFGWGKPVIVNLYNFKKPKLYYLLSSLAGPASNLLICGICLAILYMHPHRVVYNFLKWTFLINGMLAAINLVPVPPLDGSKIWPCLIPGMKPTISGKWSMIWVVVLIVGLQTGGISKILGPVQDGMWWLLPECKTCNSGGATKIRPEGFPKVLIDPGNATNVYYKKTDNNAYWINYVVHEKMAGVECYNELESRLREFGWRKLRFDYNNPKKVHKSEWKETETGKKEIRVFSCFDGWVNSSEDMIKVIRIYNSFEDKDVYSFMIDYSQSGEGENSTFYKYKQLHPEEFEGVEIVETVAKPENQQ
jgi:Zn-dependent protease